MTLISDLRLDIGDDEVIASGVSLRYTDAQLVGFLQKSARRINRILDLTDTTDEIAVSSSGVLTPTNTDFEDLVLLQAECLISTREVQADLSSGGGGVVVKDGEQNIDTKQRTASREAFYASPHNPCAQLELALKIEKVNRNSGKLVW